MCTLKKRFAWFFPLIVFVACSSIRPQPLTFVRAEITAAQGLERKLCEDVLVVTFVVEPTETVRFNATLPRDSDLQFKDLKLCSGEHFPHFVSLRGTQPLATEIEIPFGSRVQLTTRYLLDVQQENHPQCLAGKMELLTKDGKTFSSIAFKANRLDKRDAIK